MIWGNEFLDHLWAKGRSCSGNHWNIWCPPPAIILVHPPAPLAKRVAGALYVKEWTRLGSGAGGHSSAPSVLPCRGVGSGEMKLWCGEIVNMVKVDKLNQLWFSCQETIQQIDCVDLLRHQPGPELPQWCVGVVEFFWLCSSWDFYWVIHLLTLPKAIFCPTLWLWDVHDEI